MVCYEELIYAFADVYLGVAVEASICRENYEMANDDAFLEEYMGLFVSLIQTIENDRAITLGEICEKLDKSKQEVLDSFSSFLENKIVEQAVEHVTREKNIPNVTTSRVFSERIQEYHDKFFDDEYFKRTDSPSKSLEYIRNIEEGI